jgi:hypothetical protein
MHDLPPFANHFARLVWLLTQQPDDREEHKEQLRQALSQLSSEPQRIVLHDIAVAVATAVSQQQQPESLAWFGDMSVRMSAHSVAALEFEVAAPAREVMEVARAVASLPSPGDGGEAFDAKLVSMGVTAQIGPMGFVRRAMTEVPVSEAILRTPSAGVSSFVLTPTGIARQPGPTPRGVRAQPAAASESQSMMQQQIMPLAKPNEGSSALVIRLDAAESAPNASAVVDDIARAAEDLARHGSWEELVDVLDRLIEHYQRQHDGDLKRAYLMGLRRLERPMILHGVARLLPRHRDLRDRIIRILARAGETGADALIDNLISSDDAAERRAYRDALAQCPAAIGALLHLLSDERWYVVRNVLDLLGDLAPQDVEPRVAEQLRNSEPRVRRSAAIALGKIGTARAVLALLQAVNDESPEVRAQAAHGLGKIRSTRAAPWLIEALDGETDPDVQTALIAALGQMATEDAVARLIRTAEPGGMLIRKPIAQRIRAIEALGVSGTTAAKTALRELVDDRDRDVRDAAERALSRTAPKAG